MSVVRPNRSDDENLVIEDDKTTGAHIADAPRQDCRSVDFLTNGSDGPVQATAAANNVHAIERMLPGLDGVALVKTRRGAKNRAPIFYS